jgi:hypothetical protein
MLRSYSAHTRAKFDLDSTPLEAVLEAFGGEFSHLNCDVD